MDPLLQDEETQLVTALASLEASASRQITELFGSSLDDRAVFNARSTRIREDLAALRAAARNLAILAEEQDTEEQASRLAEVLKVHQAEYEKLQTALKQANIQARRNTEVAAAEARKAMLAGGQAQGVPAHAAGQADAVAASQGITKSLLQTRQLMAQELEHTSATLAAMDASNERLAEGREELRGHRGLFSGSRQLLRALFRSSVLDTMSLYGGLAIFFIVVAYILQKRTLYFAPIGKVMAPVAGTAWNASRSVAQRAGQLPSAVSALHRRLNAKGHGAPPPVEDELPAPVERILQGDSTGDSDLEDAWKQEPTPPTEQQGADAGSGGTSDDGAQQWAQAEPGLLADLPAPPDDGAAADDQPNQGQQTDGKTPPAELLPDAAQTASVPDGAGVHGALGDMPDEEQPTAPADEAGGDDAGGDPPVADRAIVSDATQQPTADELPGKPAVDDTAASAAPAQEDSLVGDTLVLQPEDQLDEMAAAGATSEPAAASPDPAAAAPAAAAAGTPADAAGADGASDGALGVQLQPDAADRQQDGSDPHGSPAGESPAAVQEGGLDKTAGAAPAAAPSAEPAASVPIASGIDGDGTVAAPGQEQVELSAPAPAAEAGIEPATGESAVLPPDADAVSATPGDAAEQLPAPPVDPPAHVQVQAEDNSVGLPAAADPSDAENSLPSSEDAIDTPAGKTTEALPAENAAQTTTQPVAASEGMSAATAPEASVAQHQPGAAHGDVAAEDAATPLQPELPEPTAAETGAAAGGEAGSQQEPPRAAAVDIKDTPPEELAVPVEPALPATPAPEVEAAAAPPSGSDLLPEEPPAATISGGTGQDMQRQEDASTTQPADQQQTNAEGMPEPAATPKSEENVIYDEHGNKFEWRWHPEAGTAGEWKLYVAGTDTLVQQQPDDEAAASTVTAPAEAAPIAQSEGASVAQSPVQEQPAPAVEPVHDEL